MRTVKTGKQYAFGQTSEQSIEYAEYALEDIGVSWVSGTITEYLIQRDVELAMLRAMRVSTTELLSALTPRNLEYRDHLSELFFAKQFYRLGR